MSEKIADSPHAGHKARLRERFAKEPLALPDYEILELLLGYAILRKDTKALAKDLLARLGSLRGVLDARPVELRQSAGFGPGLELFIRLLHEVMARYAASPARERTQVMSSQTVARMGRARLVASPHEECWIALLDTQNNLLSWERLRIGDVSFVQISPREVLETVLKTGATGFILVHNHPGGNIQPSAPDLEITEKIRSTAKALELRFLDHVIVTERASYSLAACGLIDDTGE